MIGRVVLRCWVAVLLVMTAAASARCGEPPPPGQELRFRRIFAPANRMQGWPLGGAKYLPLDMRDFERLLAVAQSQPPEPGWPPLAYAAAARYQARLVGDRLVDGQAWINVVLRGTVPAFLPLEPCNLPLEKAWWVATDRAAETAERRALLGSGGDGRTSVWVERSGRLGLAWSLAGHRDPSEALAFSLEVPRSPRNRMTLDLPEGLVPTSDEGLVAQGGVSGEHMRRWRLEFGGHRHLHLRLASADQSQSPSARDLLQESCVYDFSPHGVEVTAQWKVLVGSEPLSQLIVRLDPGLQLVTAQCGDAPASWSAAPAADGQPTQVVIALPESTGDRQRVLRLGALAPLVLDRRWRLPRLRAEGLSWQEGELRLLTPEPLTADRLMPIDCAQSDTEPLAAPRIGVSSTFQCFRPEATVEVVLARRRPVVQWTAASDLALGTEQTTLRATYEFHVDDGAQSQLKGLVDRAWTIDTVESVPAGGISDWTLEPRGGEAAALAVRLARPLVPARPVRLVISARQVHAPTQTFRVGCLLPIRFLDVGGGRHWLSLRGDGPYEVRVPDIEQLKLVDPATLSAEQADLFAAPPQGLVLEEGSFPQDLTASLIVRKPKYSASIRTEAVVGKRTIRENYRFRCIPEEDRVDRVFVRFYPRRDAPPRWTLRGDDEQLLPARRLSNEQQEAAGLAVSAEVWEISLPRPRSAPFEIAATRETNLGKQQPLSLAALPEAIGQGGTVVIRVTGSASLQIENRRLEPLPPESLTPDGSRPTIQDAYRYDPLQDTAPGPEAALCVSVVKRPALPDAWIWSSQLESWYETCGTIRHRASYELQNLGGQRLVVWLPSAIRFSDIRGVWIDSDQASWNRLGKGERVGIAVDLPADRRFPIVTVEWTALASGLGRWGVLRPPRLETSLPTLAHRWMVWLPSDYDLVTPAAGWPGTCSQWTLSQRLLGWLGRGANVGVFNPFSAKDWVEPLSGFGPFAKRAKPAADASTAAESQAQQTLEPQAPWQSGGSGTGEVQGWRSSRVELSGDPPSLYYVQRDGLRLLTMVVFLATVGVGSWTIVRHPLLLIGLLGTCAMAALGLPPVWASIASAAMIGLLFCVAWGWIRRRGPAEAQPPAADTPALPDKPALPEKPPSSSGTASGMASVGRLLLAMAVGFSTGAVARADGPPAAPASASAAAIGDFPAATPHTAVAAPPPDAAAGAYRVFVPINAQQKPAGDTVYLPEPFYQELYRRAEVASGPFCPWLVLSAAYRGALTREAVSGRLVLEGLKASYDLQVFAPATQVRIPMRGDEVNLMPGGVVLDGRTVPAKWTREGTALLIDVAEVGRCRLELALQPRGRSSGGPAGLALAIPRVADSRLELSLPDPALAIEIPSARGTVRRSQFPPQLTAELGPTDRLNVRWRKNAADRPIAAEVEQLMWLRFLPGSVVIDAKFKIRPLAGQLQQLQLLVDRRLRLLPLDGDGPGVTVQEGTGRTKLITLSWPSPLRDETTLTTTFLWTETSGVGHFRLPRLEVVDRPATDAQPGPNAGRPSSGMASRRPGLPDRPNSPALRVTERWLAISVDASLDGEEHYTRGLEGPLVSDFLSAWGESDARPQSAYRLTACDNDWQLSTQPHPPSTIADQRLALCFDRREVEMAFDAELTTTAGYQFQYRIAGPAGWKLERVSLLEQDVERAGRWSQDPDGTISLFLTGSVSDRQKLSLYGRLPMERHNNWPVPAVHIEHCRVHTSTVELFRRPAVQASWQCGEGVTSMPASVQAAPADFGRFLAGFRMPPGRGTGTVPIFVARGLSQFSRQEAAKMGLSPSCPIRHKNGTVPCPQPPLTVTVLPNHPQVHARQVLSLRGSGRAWTVQVDCSVEVAGGVVDRLWLRAPPPWNGPYTVSSPGTLEVREIPGEGRHLVFQPQSPITRNLQFRISGPLSLGREDRPRAPDVAIRDVDALQRWVALPEQSQGQSLIWQTRGLRRCGSSQVPSLPVGRDVSLYSVVGPSPQSVLQSSTLPRNSTLVRMADISLAWRADGTCQGIALFDLEPGGATECPLSLPEGQELVQLLIDGNPAAPQAVGGEHPETGSVFGAKDAAIPSPLSPKTVPVPLGMNGGEWRVPLISKRLPQRIEVAFRGRAGLPDPAGRLTLAAPALGDLHVGQTLWTVAGPAALAPGIPQSGQLLDACQQQWLRLKSIAAVVRSASAVSADEPDATLRWYPVWIRRLVAARAAVQGAIVPGDARGLSRFLRQDATRMGLSPSAHQPAETLRAECEAIDREQSQLAEKLDVSQTYRQLSTAAPVGDGADALWTRAVATLARPTRLAIDGGASSITLQYCPVREAGWLRRLAAAMAAAILALATAVAWHRGLVQRLVQRWPAVVVSAVGLVWWLWLWPSLLGLLIVVGGLLAALGRRVSRSR